MTAHASEKPRIGLPAWALVASLAIHLIGLGWVSSRMTLGRSRADEWAPDTPHPERVHLGLDEARQVRVAWLGFVDPTPHAAAQGQVEQSALDPDAGRGVRRAREAARAIAEALAPSNAARAVERLARPLGDLFLRAAQAAADQARQAQASTPEGSSVQPPEQEQAEGDAQAIRDERESVATSLEETLEYRNGRVEAGQGLKIITVRPEWSTVARQSALPQNPVVQVRFDRGGRVTKAWFKDGLATGYRDVDQPLLEAIYRWRAEGQTLQDLPEHPEASLTVTIRVILR